MRNLDTYLNDHLAGSVTALESIDHLLESSDDAELKGHFTALREDIRADQIELENLLREIGLEQSGIRKAGAWIAEKLSRPKLQIGPGDHWLGLFQTLEFLSLGILGKRSLWRTLSAASATILDLRGLDYDRLEKRAEAQFERVEAMALQRASSVLSAEV